MTEKKPYILKRQPDPVIARLEQFYDYQLSIQGEIYQALQKEIDLHGKHGTATADIRPPED